MVDFLLELRSEEIPARMQDKARDDLARLFTAELGKAGLTASDLTTYATPRRLILIARDLPLETAATSEETKGPKTSAPSQALEGFLRKTGLTAEQLIDRDGTLFAVIDKPGRATASVLAEAIPAIVRAFPWPKSMRWGQASTTTESLKWVRPLQGIVALLGEEVVPCEIAGISSGAATLGHRFHHPGVITIGSAADYVEKLRACHVIVDQDERRRIIAAGARDAARAAGLELIDDDGLLVENAGLTEWPVPLLGRFDAAFLDVPPEVIQLTARVNQKYFVCRDADGKLANAFVCTANIDAADGGTKIVEGNRKVLAARLSDAKFFYDTDLKVPLDEQAKKLGSIVFHEKLGTVADKVDRVAKLARWLVEEGIVGCGAAETGSSPAQGVAPPSVHVERSRDTVPSEAEASTVEGLATARHGPSTSLGENGEVAILATQAERAARLCKADLVTGMVGEFPELQGLMGGYYALAQGEDPAVAQAIRDHYKPVGQGDDVPTAPVTVAVSLADKLDTALSFLSVGLGPTGSKDPFAIRRSILSCIALIQRNELRGHLVQIADAWAVFSLKSMQEGFEQSASQSNVMKAYNNQLEILFNLLLQYQLNLITADVTKILPQRPGDIKNLEWVELLKSQIEDRSFYLNTIRLFADRLKVQQREAGVRHDLIDAVFALGGEDDLVRLLARVRALQAFVGTPDGANLLAGYKRAANILKKEGWDTAGPPTTRHPGLEPGSRFLSDGAEGSGTPDQVRGDERAGAAQKPLSYTPEKDEAALIAALDSAAPRAAAAVAAEDFEGAMAALASLRAPIDAFFDTVTVNDPDPARRSARLDLLARVRVAVHTVADFSKIDG